MPSKTCRRENPQTFGLTHCRVTLYSNGSVEYITVEQRIVNNANAIDITHLRITGTYFLHRASDSRVGQAGRCITGSLTAITGVSRFIRTEQQVGNQ